VRSAEKRRQAGRIPYASGGSGALERRVSVWSAMSLLPLSKRVSAGVVSDTFDRTRCKFLAGLDRIFLADLAAIFPPPTFRVRFSTFIPTFPRAYGPN